MRASRAKGVALGRLDPLLHRHDPLLGRLDPLLRRLEALFHDLLRLLLRLPELLPQPEERDVHCSRGSRRDGQRRRRRQEERHLPPAGLEGGGERAGFGVGGALSAADLVD